MSSESQRGDATDGLRRLRGVDDGFTFVELLVALSLLLMSLIAVTGLSMTSSMMTASSRQQAAMVNASASYLERVHQVPFGRIGIPSGDPSGTLLPAVTVSGSYTVAITPAVTWGRPEDPAGAPSHGLKTVTLSVTSSGPLGGSVMSHTTSAVFADVGIVSRPWPRDSSVGTTGSSLVAAGYRAADDRRAAGRGGRDPVIARW